MTAPSGAPAAATYDSRSPDAPSVATAGGVELRQLDWDTAFFGARMGSITRTTAYLGDADGQREALARDLRALLAFARAVGYAHAIFRTPGEDLPAAWGAARAGLRLVDVGLDSTFTFGTAALPAPSAAIAVRPHRPDDLPALRDLAAAAFVLSRFSADPFFSKEQVKAFHRQWITNLCNGLAQAVLVCEVEGEAAGFISCAMNGAEGRIPLIATDARHRRLGIGRALVGASLHWFAGAGARAAHVKTQAHNYPALALYHGAGFAVSTTELTFSIAICGGNGGPA
jgi:ribosomal protein S18 acetylase RimI-like enzyme